MSTPAKLAMLLVIAFVIAIGGVLLLDGSDETTPVSGQEADNRVVRDDSRILGAKGSSDVVLTEFLDFECEACGAAFPIIEDLRQKYDGEVTFVARYFPLPGHFNAERAARAVESAARQDKFLEMYQLMYETQREWGEQQSPADDVFRGFAEQLDLDMEQFDTDYSSEEVAERVQRDVDDGMALGVKGTPTFFLNGERFEPQQIEDFDAAIDELLAK
ncbi:disulfide bond formation protein DsbA [Nocardioides sp. Soil797]|nr:disulfide bond formation protein DsbA [Nocardioides sp. Soil797]